MYAGAATLEHEKGHIVPQRAADIDAMVNFLRSVVVRAQRRHHE
jgi:hypothetical protein